MVARPFAGPGNAARSSPACSGDQQGVPTHQNLVDGDHAASLREENP
jgi:hypothetical protein